MTTKRITTLETPRGTTITVSVDRICGYAGVVGIDEDGDIEFDGETDVDWDSQKSTVDGKGRTVFGDDEGTEWVWNGKEWETPAPDPMQHIPKYVRHMLAVVYAEPSAPNPLDAFPDLVKQMRFLLGWIDGQIAAGQLPKGLDFPAARDALARAEGR